MKGSHDLVLMDIQLPILDGITATAYLREKGFSAPILALTAYAWGDEKSRAIEVGFDEYISKPVACNELLKIIERWMPPSRALH